MNDKVKRMLKSKDITEDKEKSDLKIIQDQTDKFINLIAIETNEKEKEIINI